MEREEGVRDHARRRWRRESRGEGRRRHEGRGRGREGEGEEESIGRDERARSAAGGVADARAWEERLIDSLRLGTSYSCD